MGTAVTRQLAQRILFVCVKYQPKTVAIAICFYIFTQEKLESYRSVYIGFGLVPEA